MNNFILQLVAGLSKSKSMEQIKSDAQKLGDIKTPLVGTLNKAKTRAQIKQDLASMNGTINLTGKFNQKGVVTSVQQATQQAQKAASRNPIQVSMSVKKDKLINDIKVFGQQNTKLFKDANMSAKYNSLLDNAKLATSGKELQNLRLQLSAMRSEVKATNLSGLTLGDTFKKTFKRATELFTGTAGVMALSHQLREAWTQALELDKAYTDLIKVQDELTRGDYHSYLEQCNKKAQKLATTQKSLIEGAAEFSRSGYTRAESDQLAEKSTILSNVGDMSATDSAKAIISGVQAYDVVDGYDNVIDKAGALIDKYNEIGNTASITTAEIAQGVQTVGSVFSDANTSVDQFIALLSAGNRQFQDADTLALGLRTAALRIRGCEAQLEQLGETTDGVYTSASKLAAKIEGLTNIDGKGGVQILEADGETFRSIYDIFVDISKVYQQMSDTDQSALLDLIAGKNRASAVSATLNNMTEAQEIYERSLNSAESAQREYDTYRESSEASMNRFKSTMTETYQSVISGQTVTALLNCGNATLQFVNNLGLVESTLKGLVAIGIVKAITTLSTAFKATAISASNFGTALNTVKNMSSMAKGTTEYKNALQSLKTVSAGLSETQLKQVLSSKALSDSDKVAILRTTGLTKAQAQAKLAQMGLTQSTQAQTTANASATASTFSLTAAVKGFGASLKAAFMSNPIGITIMAISTAVGAISSAVSTANQKADEARQKAKDAADTASTLSNEISGLTGKYLSLSEAVKTDSSSKEELMTVQDELIKKLGAEGESVDSLISKYGSLDEAIKNLTLQELGEKENDLLAGVKAAEDELKDIGAGYEHWYSMTDRNLLSSAGDDAVKAYDVLNKAGIISDGSYGTGGGSLVLTGDDSTIEGILENYQKLQDAMTALRESDQFTEEELKNNPVFNQIYDRSQEMKEFVDGYNDAITELNKNVAQQQTLTALKGTELPDTEEEFDTFRDNLIKTAQSSDEFIGSQEDIENAINSYLSTVPQFSSYYGDLSSAVENTTDSVKDMKKKLQSEVDSEEDKAAAEKEAEWKRAYQDTVNRFTTNDNKKGDGKIIKDFLKSENIDSQLELEYFNKVTKNAKSAAEAIELYNQAKKNGQSAQDYAKDQSFKTAWSDLGSPDDEAIQSTQEDLTALAKAGKLTKEAFHGTSGADKWAKSFKELGLSTQDVIDRINQMQNSADQLSSMKTGISGIAQILGQKKSNLSSKKTRNDGIGADVLAGLSDEVKQNKKEYEEFCEVLGNGNSTMEDCRKASNKLASAYVNSSNFLAKLTPETKAYYTSILDEMGVENASQVVKGTLAKKNELLAAKKKYLAEQGENVANAEAKDITKFAESKHYSDQLTNSLLLLAMRKKLVNGTQLNFDSDIGQIKSFVKAIGAQITALNALQNWKRNQSKLQGMPEDVRQIKKQEYMKDAQKEVDAAVKKAEKGTKVKVDVTPDISNTDLGKKNKKDKSKSKDSKQEIDWIARKLEVLQKAIDTTSGKLQNLFSIKDQKNNINKQITETTALLKANRKAAKAYTAEANKVKLGGKLKAKVRSGDYDITKYSSKTADKINKYQDLIDKAREAQDAVQDNIASIHDLNQQKLDNITTWYDKLLEKIDAVTSKLQAKSDLTSKVRGMLGQAETGTKTEYTDILKNQKSALKTSQTELKNYNKERRTQRNKLVNKNKSNRQTTEDFLKRSGLSKKAINKELKKFDKKNDVSKQLADFDATTKAEAAKLKENVYSAMSEMLDTAQSLANIPLEKLSVTLDKLSTQFTVLENQASRAAKEIENAGTGLGYYTRKSQAQIDNKSSAQYQARLTKETAVSSRDAAANKLRAKGIDPSTIKTANDLEKFANNTDAMYWASQYLAGVSAVNDATSQLSSVQEDYASTVSSVTDNIIDERNKLYENERSRKESKHTNDEKEYDYTDVSLKDRLDTIDVKLDHQKTDTVDSIKKQADKSLGEAAHAADSFYGYKTMGYLNSQPAWVQNAFNKAYSFMQRGYNFNPATDNISDAYISSDILEALKQAVQDGYLPSTEYEQVVKYNANIADGNNQYQTYANNKATYDYETVPNSFKEIFSTISDDADRTVSDIQRNIDAIENSLDSDLFANKTDSYKKEADYYANQKQVYVNEGDALRKQLALAEAKGLKQGSDTWNELMNQIHTADDNAEKAAQSYTNAVVNAFNSIGDIADRKITEIGKSLSNLDTQMSLYETQGHFITSEFYNGQGDLYKQQQEAELKKADDLQAELDADVASGKIKEYSARWYEMKDKIDEATQSADDYSVKIAEATNKAFDAILQLGEKSREAITRMNDEADFYKDILGRDKLVNEKTGAFTANGVASISLSYEKMTNNIVDNQNIQREIEDVKKRYKNGNNPEYGIEQYNEDMDNLLSQQREAIKNYYDEREAVMSLISDGLQKQLDVLQDIVDKTKEAMDRTSDLRDYQNNVEEATKNISSLEKQLAVVQGNDSEEGRATAQSLQKQLEDAQKNLDDLEWDKKKSDMTNILDDLMENAQDYVDEKRNQVSDTLDEIRDSLQEDAPKVIETLQGLDDLWGTSMSDAFKNAVSTGDYSTITNSIDSAASKITQAVYDSEKAKLESTPKPVIKESDKYSSKAEKLLNQYASKNVKVGTTRFETIFDQKMQDWKEGYHLSTDSARKMLKELTDHDVDGITDEFVHYMLIDTLKANHIGGFAKGGVIGALNEQVRKNNDDALISVQSGEGILTPQQTEMFQRLVGELPALVNIADVKVPNFPTTQNTSKTVNVELGDMHFDLPNVTDTDSFINAWKTDNKMKNFVSDVVTGAVTGDNSKAMRY